MSDETDINELIRLFQVQPRQEEEVQNLEQLLLSMILNPVKLTRQRIVIEDMADSNVVYEIREGTIINEHGVQEEHQDLIINSNIFIDGTPKNLFGVAKCPHCGETVNERNLVACGFCGRICCVSVDCSRYSRNKNLFYCSTIHRILGFFFR